MSNIEAKLNAILEYLGLECEIDNMHALVQMANMHGALVSSQGLEAVEKLNLPTIEPKYKITKKEEWVEERETISEKTLNILKAHAEQRNPATKSQKYDHECEGKYDGPPKKDTCKNRIPCNKRCYCSECS